MRFLIFALLNILSIDASANTLPSWDLTTLYQNHSQCLKDVESTIIRSEDFSIKYENNVKSLDARSLALAIKRYEKISEAAAKASSYSYLQYITNMNDPQAESFKQNISEKVSKISSKTLFFPMEINQIGDQRLKIMLAKSRDLKLRENWLRDIRRYKPYILSKDAEKILNEKNELNRNSWIRLYEKTVENFVFKVENETLNFSEIISKSSDPSRENREKAAKAFAQNLKKESQLFAMIMNIIIKDKAIEDEFRGFKRPISSMNLSNLVEDEITDALIEKVKKNYTSLSHRYYAMKKNWLKLDKMREYDRNAPLNFTHEKKYSWNEAKEIVLSAYGQFSPEMSKIAQMFFDNKWIDAAPKKGKRFGAFSHPVSTNANPYIMVNFHGKNTDVMTLAHELGHGIHQYLSKNQGYLMSDTPLTLAETASLFGEQLTFRYLLNKTENKNERKSLIAHKVEDMLNTTIRQIAFANFEIEIHNLRKKGEITPEQFGKIWLKNQKDSLGPSFDFTDNYKYYWSYISHFFGVPFYVYSYAFGECLVNSLYSIYQKTEDKKEFIDKYEQMLAKGGSQRHREMLIPFNIDLKDPEFWQEGLNLISNLIDELEKD